MYLAELTSYVPDSLVSVESLQNHLGLNRYQAQLLSRIHRIETVAIAEGVPVVELVARSIRKLFEKESVKTNDIRAVLYCHTIQTVAPFPKNLILEWQKEFGLEHAIGFSMTMQNCASSIGVLEVAQNFLRNEPSESAKVLVVTGEKAFTPSVQLIPGISVMGEASAACLISKKAGPNQILSVEQVTLGQFSNGVRSTPAQLKEFQDLYAPTVVQTIRNALEKASVSQEEIKYIAPHNINVSSWKSVAQLMGFPLQQIYLKNVARYGHCFCSDVFLNLDDLQSDGLIAKGDVVVLVSVGLGATFGAAVVRH